MPKVPLAISSQSRRKLKTFEFQNPENDHDDNDNKENDRATQKSQDEISSFHEEGVPQKEICKSKCPQTPGNKDRLDFEDLIANPEDAFNREITATPNDQIEWRNGPGSSAPSSSAVALQRSRKRVRNSSPSSSQPVARSKHFFNDKDAMDLESISRSLRIAKQDDPLLALWDRYADSHDRGENTEPVLPPLPPLSSSPNTPGSHRKGDTIRRTASCGIEWPTSATKRRKISDKDPYCRARGIFAASKGGILGPDHSRSSRVSLLVDSIHQSLIHKVIHEEEAPASSSPLPRAHEGLADINEQPELIGDLERKQPNIPDLVDSEEHENSSEFGDVDFDLDDPDLLVALDQAATQPAPSIINKGHLTRVNSGPVRSGTEQQLGPCSEKTGPVPNRNDLHIGREEHLRHERPSQVQHGVLLNHTSSGIATRDSFGDFDDDDEAFTTELAELADQVESQDAVACQARSVVNNESHQISKTATQAEFDDAFDDDDDVWKEIECEAVRPTVPVMGSTTQKHNDHRTIKRYLILDVLESRYNTPQGRTCPQKVLSIKDEKTKQLHVVYLRQSWYESQCTKGAYIHLIGNFNMYGECFVDDTENMLILHPDHLVSATVVADSFEAFGCTRRAILQDRIKATSPPSAPQVYGHLIHEVFGEALRLNRWDMIDIRQMVDRLLPNYIESLYEINVQPSAAIEYVMSKMPDLKAWACVHVGDKLTHDGGIRDRFGVTTPMIIDKLLELEEHVWSPMYGLKGNIDATVQAQMKLPGEDLVRTLTVPLELKTGKRDTSEMHRAQTALYTLLLSDRYDLNVTTGILYYLETSKTFRVEGIRNEIRHMIIKRNELACFIHNKLALPPMIKKEHLCKKCYAQTSCFAYHKLVEDGDGDSSGMKEIFNEAVGHLKPIQQNFFKKWDDLLTKEERDAMKFKRELWTMLSSEREAVGRCFANVTIEPGSAFENLDSPKINRYNYSFNKPNANPGFSFTESQIIVGDPIVISDERGHFALANGFISKVRPNRITVAVDRRLQNARHKQPGFDAERNQVFSGIMEVGKEGSLPVLHSSDLTAPTLYRIDKDEFANGMAVARNNIIRIMEKGLWRARELRQLIVENKTPTFKCTSTAYSLTGPASQQNLNVDQKQAIEKVMSAKDYALVLGMPGTGKTTTIAHIIRALVAKGKSVLLTSYTHTAVDNILLKIKDDSIPILRLGGLGKIHPDVQSFADLGGVPKKNIAELETSWTKSKVVATTCLGINHAIFNHRTFDYCIVDEASQITLPVCLGPIRMASVFVLVGDHYQLPPLVQNKEAQEGGLDISLFKLLSDAQPSSVVNLEHQYRMAEDIMLLSNKLIYSDRLKCGTPAVASRILEVPRFDAGMEAHHYTASTYPAIAQPRQICTSSKTTHCWLHTAITPKNRVVFLNTDSMCGDATAIGAPEVHSGSGNRITNPTEAVLTAQLLTTLIRSGVPPRSIGVITFYRSQLALLKLTVKSLAGTSAASDVEMHTADKYQGRDKEIILLSCVRSNEASNVGELLKDWRRVNVALTRAKSKLIIIGSAKTMRSSNVPVLEGMIDIVTGKGWLVDLPVNADMLHPFEGRGTQTQLSQPGRNVGVGTEPVIKSPHKMTADGSKKRPLGLSDGNAVRKTTGEGMRRPAKTVNGSIGVQKLLDKSPIMRDVINEFDLADFDDF